jgi:protease-4
MRPTTKFEKKKSLLYGTILLLIAGFIVLLILFAGFSAMLPSFMGRCVAVVDVDMPLTIEGAPSSLFSQGYAGSEELAAQFESLDKRPDVGAVVIVFNSPGGSVVATREVYSAVKRMDKPTVSYFREVAASGAYYVAAGTDHIVSDPDALTGSIGVVATFAEMSGLLEELGVNITTVTSGPHKDIGSFSRPMSEAEYNITKALIEEVFLEFKQIITDNRGSKLDAVLFNKTLDGRILSGRQANAAGLVDETGSKRDAIMKAADLANISYTKYSDIRICPSTNQRRDSSLLSAESLFSLLNKYQGMKISYE